MKRIVFAPAALVSFDDILTYTIDRFGIRQAEIYTKKLSGRLEALAQNTGPKARSCELLMRGVREASGLRYYHEGSHFLILRISEDTLEIVEILHERMHIEAHLRQLMNKP